MATKLGIYNGALRHLKSERLVTVTDAGKKRYELDAAYDDAVEWCLEQSLWNFATRAVELTHDGAYDPDWGYAYSFDKPTDWVRTAALSTDEYGAVPLLSYEDRDDVWLADVTPLYLWYVSNHATEGGGLLTRWPQTFAEFVSLRLAYMTCGVITGGTEMTDTLEKRMIRAKRDAANKDAMNQPSAKFPPAGSLVRSRGGAGLGSREGRFRAG